MDDFHFDEVARSLAGGGETRRGLLRLVAGGVLGGVTSRLGLAAGAAAKSGKHRRQRQGAANRNEALQAEGKRKKCKKRKPQLCDPYCEEEGAGVAQASGAWSTSSAAPARKRATTARASIPWISAARTRSGAATASASPGTNVAPMPPVHLAPASVETWSAARGSWSAARARTARRVAPAV
jgi:hypothetical protein